jgi:aminopeptidase N
MDRHYPNPDSMFDGRAYPKGAWVLHMLRNKLGDEAFWKGIQRYGTEHKFQSVETVDFRRSMEQASGRDLERFFYDWLERPGNPDLEVATEYAADAQQVRIAVKQAQGGEPFHFPFKVVLHHSGSSEPLIVEEEMTEKETTLRIPLPGLLTRVDVDPDSAILTELKETKSHDLWRGQLLEAANVPGRLRAAKHFTQTKTDEDRELLAQAFRAEKFWAVRLELAKALGEAGGIVCRDALLQGLQHADARIRRACVDGLAKFKSEDAVVTAMKGLLQKGDPSYGVESAALLAYAKLGQKDAIVIITPWLSKPSHDDTLAAAALEALGATQDSAALETLLKWTEPGHPRNLRTAAQRALIPMTKSKQLTDAQRQQIVKLLVEALESNQGFGRFRILMALPDLGPLAASALPAIDKIVAEASEGFMRGRVKEIADKIRAQAKTEINPAASSSDVNQLRDEVKRLQREKEELRKRLEQYEKAGAGK